MSFVTLALRHRLRLTKKVIHRKQYELRSHQQNECWQQARLDAWEDDGVHPSVFEQEYPEPKDTP